MVLSLNRTRKDREITMKTIVKNAFVSLFIATTFLLVLSSVQAQVLGHSGDVSGNYGFSNRNGGWGNHSTFGGAAGMNVSPAVTVLGE